MKRKIFFTIFVLIIFIFNRFAFAQDGVPVITYTLNETSADVISDPTINTVQLGFISDENIENWVSVTIKNKEDPSIYKTFKPGASCDETSECNQPWKGEISPSDKTLVDGIYNVIVHIKNITGITFDLTLTSPYTIQVKTSAPADTTAPIITLKGDAIINLDVDDPYEDLGATALDAIDGDLTNSIIIKGVDLVDNSIAGTYTITYDVSDNAGNLALQVVRTINIKEKAGGTSDTNPNPSSLFEGNINLLDNCSIKDTNGGIHIFPQEDSPSKYLGICALSQAKEQGIINDVKLDYYSGPDGLFVNSINGISKENTYWALYINDVYETSRGLSILPLSSGDKVSLILTTYSGEIVLPKNSVEINITSLQQPEEQKISGGGGSSHILNNKFDVDKALAYLISKQNSDGSFGSPMYTDWVAIAATAGDNSSLKSSILNYIKANPFNSSSITDNERHAMALMALGINPYNGTEINYIKKITDSFNGTQFGNKDLVNDDIFAIFPLIKAGYNQDDEMIQKDISFIVSKQGIDGSWGSVDLTAAAVQALSLFSSASGVSGALSRASSYLQKAQGNDGGWGNISSSSWVAQAMSTLSATWMKNNKTVSDYFAEQQEIDGAILPLTEILDNRIWATSYAVPAMMSKSWGDIMQSFQKPNDPIVCPRGDLFSTITGQACTTTDETNIITINTPINNQKPDLVKKIEDKKIIEVPKIKSISKSDFLKNSLSPTSEISVENNLGVSAGNAMPIEISIKKISQIVINSVIDILTYIGKGFYDLIIFLPNKIGAVLR